MKNSTLLAAILLAACTPQSPPVVTPPAPKPVDVPLVVVTQNTVAALTFRVTWGDSVESIQWLGAKFLPVDSGRVTSGVLIPRATWDTVAMVRIRGKPPSIGTAPWRFEVLEVTSGKTGGYLPVSVGLVTVLAGKPR